MRKYLLTSDGLMFLTDEIKSSDIGSQDIRLGASGFIVNQIEFPLGHDMIEHVLALTDNTIIFAISLADENYKMESFIMPIDKQDFIKVVTSELEKWCE